MTDLTLSFTVVVALQHQDSHRSVEEAKAKFASANSRGCVTCYRYEYDANMVRQDFLPLPPTLARHDG
jgi:hypothetical protein